VRGNDVEFFLFDVNFILSNDGIFEVFKNNILTIIKSSLEGSYEIEIVKFGNIKSSSTLGFQETLKVQLYKHLFNSFFSALPSLVTKHMKKEKAIIDYAI
jgi:hypothetical protein